MIRGYFSSKTHPLLAPLVPQIKDLLHEFEVAGHGKVRVEIVDPAKNPEAEDEANNKYGIRPVPFQVADRYQSSLVNSYFDVLVQYGDQFEVLGFRDLIEVKVGGESNLDVQLRNPEYDITRTIKKVLYGFQSGGEVFSSIAKPLKFVGYVSADQALPSALVKFKDTVAKVLDGYVKQSDGKLSVEFVDPDAGDGIVAKADQAAIRFPADGCESVRYQYVLFLSLARRRREFGRPNSVAGGSDGGRSQTFSRCGVQTFCNGLSQIHCVDGPGNARIHAEHGRRR